MNRPSMRKQIDLMCKQCIYDGSSGSGTWKQQVTDCTSPDCALFNLRPLTQGEKHVWQIKLTDKRKKDVEDGTRKPILKHQLDDIFYEPMLPYGLGITTPKKG